MLRLAIPLVLLAAPVLAQDDDPHSPVRKPLPSPEQIAALPPDGGPEFNRLVFSESPYLLQHARNPVDWYPWGDEAFETAKAEDKPIFLSIGYSTCHWCHVMEHESFEDQEVAELMNEAFVCVKLDREERPDIDHVYMTVTQALTGRGGWPMTVLMTPEKEPFFAGTYFPKDGVGQRPGMLQLVPHFEDAWHNKRKEILDYAGTLTERLAQMSGGNPGAAATVETLALAASHLSKRFDPIHAGFSQPPKFPVPHNARLMLRHHARTGDTQALTQVERTLDAMRIGGVWDHVGHGFHRYSTDAQWLLPHFEKMLYDQALIAMAYVEAYQVLGKPEYRETVERIFEYVLRDMTDPLGGFYSAEDADSEGEEGLFYYWTVAQLKEVLGEEDGAFAARVWNARPDGNFRDEATGKKTEHNILHLEKSVAQLAADLELEPAALQARLDGLRARLFTSREGRIHPLKDDKVLTDWNGLMIAALAMAGRAFEEPRYLEAAARAASFAKRELRDPETGRLYKRWRLGSAGLNGMLEDYAYLAWGLLELFESGQDPAHLAWAQELIDVCHGPFWDAKKGGYFLSPSDGEALIVRAKEAYDGALPSGNSVMVLNLVRLARLTGKTEYEQRAWKIVEAFGGAIEQNPSAYAQLLCGVDFLLGPAHEVVVVGEREAEDTAALLRALHARFDPNKVVVLRPAGEAEPAITKLAPYTREQRAQEGKATAYVCEEFTCQAPVTTVEAMLRALAGD